MDNFPCVAKTVNEPDLDAYEELPRVEALARLYELRDRYTPTHALAHATTTAAEHLRDHGHVLRSGCCAALPERIASLG